MKFLQKLKKFWKFVWYDDSLLSWVLAIAMAFIIVKYLIFPGLGLLLGTDYPVVAVLSNSMNHNGEKFDDWWQAKQDEYDELTAEEFKKFDFKNGFNKGDIIVLIGENPKDINIGDIIVFKSNSEHPIIHRVVSKWIVNGEYHFKTKGDNNEASYSEFGELDIPEEKVIGKAVLKIPYLGWIKIIPGELINSG